MPLKFKDLLNKERSIVFFDRFIEIKTELHNFPEKLAYSDVECKMLLYASKKRGKYTYIKEICIQINVNDEKELMIIAKGNYSKVFKLLKNKINFKDFQLYALGPQDGVDVPIKIFSKFNLQLLFKDSANISDFEIFSLAMALSGVFFIVCELFFVGLLFECTALCLISVLIYQEFIKFRVRKILKLGTNSLEQIELKRAKDNKKVFDSGFIDSAIARGAYLKENKRLILNLFNDNISQDVIEYIQKNYFPYYILIFVCSLTVFMYLIYLVLINQ